MYNKMYNKDKKQYRDTDRKEAAWDAHARVMGMVSFIIYLNYFL